MSRTDPAPLLSLVDTLAEAWVQAPPMTPPVRTVALLSLASVVLSDPEVKVAFELAAARVIDPMEAIATSSEILAMCLLQVEARQLARIAALESERDALLERAQAAEAMLGELTTVALPPVKW